MGSDVFTVTRDAGLAYYHRTYVIDSDDLSTAVTVDKPPEGKAIVLDNLVIGAEDAVVVSVYQGGDLLIPLITLGAGANFNASYCKGIPLNGGDPLLIKAAAAGTLGVTVTYHFEDRIAEGEPTAIPVMENPTRDINEDTTPTDDRCACDISSPDNANMQDQIEVWLSVDGGDYYLATTGNPTILSGGRGRWDELVPNSREEDPPETWTELSVFGKARYFRPSNGTTGPFCDPVEFVLTS